MLYSVELRSLPLVCDSYRIQTCNLLIRSQMLYSVELRSRPIWDCVCKGTHFFLIYKFFLIFFDFYIESAPEKRQMRRHGAPAFEVYQSDYY